MLNASQSKQDMPLPLLALFRPFKVDEFMSVTVRKAEVISEKTENSFFNVRYEG